MNIPPFKHRRTLLERADKFVSRKFFTDINLRSRLYTDTVKITSIQHYAAPDRISYEEAVKADYEPSKVGQSFGPIWSTHWFILTVDIPDAWLGKEVHLLWKSGSEVLIWIDGQPVQGLNEAKNRCYFILSRNLQRGQQKQTIYVEMACNELFGIGDHLIQVDETKDKRFTLSQASVAVFNRNISNLLQDIKLIHDIAKCLPEENQRSHQALYLLNSLMNQVDLNTSSSILECLQLTKKFFSQTNGESQHTVYAMGHAHIDTAWLWPYAETIRKCARSWTNSIQLMKVFPDFYFTCSQAQQYEWVKQHYPSLWLEICQFVKTGQFVPVGGTWVEMDGNIPSGEACIRQFLYGQRFFQEHFNLKCKEFWLPDTFGYSGQFPQILQHCGVKRFLTQKMSWNLFNKFPHHTFYWEGIDGSSVLTHFPPGDNYGMRGKVPELLKTVTNFKDKGRSNCSAFLFGYGDGGHGPSEEMIYRLKQLENCDGLPIVKFSKPDALFSRIETEAPEMLCRWRGELYLELHNGTYTTWAQVKKGNRKCERLLQEIEFLATRASIYVQTYMYPHKQMDSLWKLLLCNQFHDVLPGTSINKVFTDAMKNYEEIATTGEKLIQEAMKSIVTDSAADGPQNQTWLVNCLGFDRREVVNIPSKDEKHELVEVEIPAFSVRSLKDSIQTSQAAKRQKFLSVTRQNERFHLDNGWIKVELDPLGRVASMKRPDENGVWREAIDTCYPANQFIIHDDMPLFWDAWDIMDYHLYTRKPITEVVQNLTIKEETRLRIVLEVKLKISETSHITQHIILDKDSPYLRFDTQVNWNENRKLLKVEFPTVVRATEASYDIQSGFIRRPNHFNTSWDTARYEVCGHKWADLSQYGFGVSVINDCKYGYSCVDGVLRLSLLKSSKNPDPTADIGLHNFSYALLVHNGSLQSAGVIEAAEAFNSPVRVLDGKHLSGVCHKDSLFTVNSKQVVVQAIKMAADGSKKIILRLHEAFGGSIPKLRITTPLPLNKAVLCSGIEEEIPGSKEKISITPEEKGTSIYLCDLQPFQIVSISCSWN